MDADFSSDLLNRTSSNFVTMEENIKTSVSSIPNKEWLVRTYACTLFLEKTCFKCCAMYIINLKVKFLHTLYHPDRKIMVNNKRYNVIKTEETNCFQVLEMRKLYKFHRYNFESSSYLLPSSMHSSTFF